MFAFLATVKFHVAITLVVLVAATAAHIWTVSLLKPAVNVLEKLTPQPGGESAGTWAWLTAAEGSGADMRRALMWLALSRVIYSILVWVREVVKSWQSMSMVFHMRAAVYDRLQRVGFSFHDQHSTGQLINRALGDLQAVRHFVQMGVHSTVDIVLFVTGYLALLYFNCSPTIALAALIPIPFWIVAIRRFAILSQPIYKKQMEASDEMVRQLTENIAGVHVVRAFATEQQEHTKFNTACQTLLERLLEGVRLRVKMNPVIRGIAIISHISLFALGAVLVQRGSLTIGDLLMFGIAMSEILGRIQQINAISDAYQHAVVSSARLFEILDSPDTTPQCAEAEPIRPGGGSVTFSHVTFGYAPGQPVLEDISFTVPAGGVVALVGPTGSGKTTLANLLARFYDPELGKIEIDGQDLRDVTVRSVREAVGYVFQETYLFSDTIARNIAYGNLTAPMDRIVQAAHIARADEFIDRLPKKYDNMIGEYGASLSGGQRQRLAIARAVLHNPRILVMDDALAAVDSDTESHIRTGLERIMTGRTVFLIASRISTARRANKIIVIENGKISQTGTHNELMEQNGYYRDVASCQFAGGGEGQTQSHMDRISRITKKSGRVYNES